MSIFTKTGTIIKIKILQNSDARNYFESNERYFLETVLGKLESEKSDTIPLTSKESEDVKKIFKKYSRFL